MKTDLPILSLRPAKYSHSSFELSETGVFLHKKLFSWALLRTFSTFEHHLEPVPTRYRYCVGSSVFILHVTEVFVATSVYLHWQLPLPALCLRCRLLTTANAYHLSYHQRAFFTMQNAGEFSHQLFGNCQFPTAVFCFFSVTVRHGRATCKNRVNVEIDGI